jgi:NADH-quinone oxidoreductase subunit N
MRFNAVVSVGWGGVLLALVGVVMSVVFAYYYQRVVVAMYMREPMGEGDWSPVSPAAALALGVSAALTLPLGVWPGPLPSLARLAARSLTL